MEIRKFSKKKDGIYKIELEDGNILLVHEDLILKYDLLISKKITEEIKEKILEENLNYLAYNAAIKYITTKMRSVKEIDNYLTKQGVDPYIIEYVIKKLEKNNYINDDLYAISFINDKISLSNDGPLKIVTELINRGVSPQIANTKIAIFTEEIEKEKIQKIIVKLQKSNHSKSAFTLKNKIQNYLLNLGYNISYINEILNKSQIKNDEAIAQKEYDKIYKRLSRKYSGKELENKVRQKMYSLGFKEYIEY